MIQEGSHGTLDLHCNLLKLWCLLNLFVLVEFSFVFVEFRFNVVFVSVSLTKKTQANKLLLSSVATGVVVSGGGMSTKSVGGSDGSEVEAGALVSCDRYVRFR